jgi:hypothetical protein
MFFFNYFKIQSTIPKKIYGHCTLDFTMISENIQINGYAGLRIGPSSVCRGERLIHHYGKIINPPAHGVAHMPSFDVTVAVIEQRLFKVEAPTFWEAQRLACLRLAKNDFGEPAVGQAGQYPDYKTLYAHWVPKPNEGEDDEPPYGETVGHPWERPQL